MTGKRKRRKRKNKIKITPIYNEEYLWNQHASHPNLIARRIMEEIWKKMIPPIHFKAQEGQKGN